MEMKDFLSKYQPKRVFAYLLTHFNLYYAICAEQYIAK